MARSAVVIGLGGSGQWVLTFLKKELLDIYGSVPANVKLLAFDFVSQLEAGKKTVGEQSDEIEQQLYEKRTKRIGKVELQRDDEFFFIGGNVKELGRKIKSGKYPHLNSFDYDYWDQQLTDQDWNLDQGTGQIRPLATLGFHKDLLSGRNKSQILQRVPVAIKALATQIKDARETFEVIVVGSVAGGTGSTMLIPFGALAKKMGGERARVRAIVVLPSAFNPSGNNKKLDLRAGAALRELSRAMIKTAGSQSSITLLPNDPDYGEISYRTAYDGVYFVDGMRGGKPVARDPQESVFPAIAIWIRQILDDKSGMFFSNYVTTNRPGIAEDPTRQREGVFGAFGVFSMVTPVHTLKQTYRLSMANRVAKELLYYPKDKDEKEWVLASTTIPGKEPPGDVATVVLTEDGATNLMREIGAVAENPSAPELIQKYMPSSTTSGSGTKGAKTVKAVGWEGILTTFPTSAEFQQVNTEIASERKYDFNTAFVPSREFNPPQDPASPMRIAELQKQMVADVTRHYGDLSGKDHGNDAIKAALLTSAQERSDELDKLGIGTFGMMCAICGAAHVHTFTSRLAVKLESILQDGEARGRLGYALAILGELIEDLSQFGAFVDSVRSRRSRIPGLNYQDFSQKVTSAQKNWAQDRSKRADWKGVIRNTFEKMPAQIAEVAYTSETTYINAHRLQVQFVREALMLDAVGATAENMREHCQDLQKQLTNWQKALRSGDTALGIRGIESESQNELDEIKKLIKDDKRSSEIEEIVQAKAREYRLGDDDINWARAGIKWTIPTEPGNTRVMLRLAPDAKNQRTLYDPLKSQDNLAFLEDVFGQKFDASQNVRPISAWVQENYANSQESVIGLADLLFQRSEPLTALVSNADPNPVGMCVTMHEDSVNQDAEVAGRNSRDNDDDESQGGFSRRLQDTLKRKLPSGNVAVEDSQDSYRLTAVRTEVGLMLGEFRTWEQCQSTYQAELDDILKHEMVRGASWADEKVAALKNLFTENAEKAAVDIEARWRRSGNTFQVMNPRIVSLLGRQQRLNLALQAWAMDWVVEVADGDQIHYEIKSPSQKMMFWATQAKADQERDFDLETLQSLVLNGLNQWHKQRDTPFDWNALATDLKSAERLGRLSTKLSIAQLNSAGCITKWNSMAGGRFDSETNKMQYSREDYRDLAAYANSLFDGLLAKATVTTKAKAGPKTKSSPKAKSSSRAKTSPKAKAISKAKPGPTGRSAKSKGR